MRLLKLTILLFTIVFTLPDINAQNKVALIIGNADYSPEDDEWESLSSPRADAEIMNRKLMSLGYETKLITDATKQQMIDVIENFYGLVSNADIGVFFYSGHMKTLDDEKDSYIVPANTRISSDIRAECFSLEIIKEMMSECDASVLFIDACRGGARNNTERQAVCYATDGQEYDRTGHKGELSTFTKSLSRHITDDLNFHDFWNLIKHEVSEQTKGALRPDGDTDNLPKVFYLIGNLSKEKNRDIHEYVDLGLSVMWATCNVGADSPEDYGDYFAWGETFQKLSYTKENSMTYGKPMENIYGNPQYDVARANWGGSWRMPTRFEFQELINGCIWVWTSQGGKNGYRVTSKKNGNSIFLPSAGRCKGFDLEHDGERGEYWSSIPFDNDSAFSYRLSFVDGAYNVETGLRRDIGAVIRPVMRIEFEQASVVATGVINGYDYVDLGLGIKWATCNIGAIKPSDNGDYFAWGETRTKKHYNSYGGASCKFDISGKSKYDAARANWGGSWRIPTESELRELISSCTWTWGTLDGKTGYLVTSKRNGNSIFLPTASCYEGKDYVGGVWGLYWSSTPDDFLWINGIKTMWANGLMIRTDSDRYYINDWERGRGCSIRPVSD